MGVWIEYKIYVLKIPDISLTPYFSLLQARKKNTEERKEQESVTRELIRIELV